MWKNLKIEIKNGIFKTKFHLIRFIGLLFIPLIYGISYVYAFFNPFEKVDNLKMSLITHVAKEDKGTPTDLLAKSLEKSVKKNNSIKMGNINMTLKMNCIYTNNDIKEEIDKNKKDNYLILAIPDLKPFAKAIKNSVQKEKIQVKQLIKNLAITIYKKEIKKPTLILNDKKNYLISFGINNGLDMGSTYLQSLCIAIDSLKNKNFLNSINIKNIPDAIQQIEIFKKRVTNYKLDENGNYIFDKNNQKIYNSLIENISQMEEHEKYGYGLAPFFISIAIWIGCMVITFAIHRKIYDWNTTPTKRYFFKFTLIIASVFVQVTILMLALCVIGFYHLGFYAMLKIYFNMILLGLIFSSIIQSIRFSIHNRNLGIIFIIFLLVIQMASSGGLFPITTQNSFWIFVNKLMPITRSMNIIRECSFETNWSNYFIQWAYLLPWLIIMPLGIFINKKITKQIAIKNNIKIHWEINKKRGKKNV